jgi:DNA-binding transcriptional LysR family regulator
LAVDDLGQSMLHARALRYLDEVARRGSIRAAAEHLNVSSSAINRQILELEDNLGAQIFHRLSKRLRLTPIGELLIAHVRQTLKDYERLTLRVEDLKGARAGDVTIATMNGLAGGLMPSVLAAFRKAHPHVQVSVKSLFAEDIVKAVLSGEADLGMAYNLPRTPGLTSSATYHTRLGAVVVPSHPLALRSPARLADCLEYPIVLGDQSMTIHGLMVAAFHEANLPFEPNYKSNSIEFMKAMVHGDEFVTFLSRIDVDAEQRKGSLVYVAIRDRHLQGPTLTLVRRSKGVLDAAVNLLEQEVKAALAAIETDTVLPSLS